MRSFRKNKYNAHPTLIDGKSFPSMGEASLYAQLKFREKIGEIKDLSCYPTVRLSAADISWKIDMQYYCIKRDCMVYAEFKGFETERYRLVKRLYAVYGKEILEVYKANKRGVYLDETIKPRGAL